MHRLLAVLALCCLAACSALPPAQEASEYPILDDGKAEPGVEKVIVVIPGAMASVGVFMPVFHWQVPDSTVLAYRFPGIDELPLDHRVDIHDSARLIADAIEYLDPEQVYMIGYSTGGPIALETAKMLDTPEVSIALISTASDAPAAAIASITGFFDVLKAMGRSENHTLSETWAENFRTLLYGRDHFTDAERAQRSAELAEIHRVTLNQPKAKLTMAHTADLMWWRLRRDPKLADARIGVFHGEVDTVFSVPRTERFARKIPADRIFLYPGQGHLLFLTSGRMYDDIRRFFELE